MRVLIVEDEPLVAQRLQRFTREILGDQLETLRVAERFLEAEAFLAEHPIDLLLLDLNLHGRSGFDLLKTATAGAFHTVIVSANTAQALEAFAYGVLDYVPKPFDRERLAAALARAWDHASRSAYHAKLLAIRKYGRVELIPVDDVLYAQGAGPYSELKLVSGGTELHNKSLERLQAVLPPVFERIHRSYLVRMTAVAALHASEGSHYEAELKNGQRLPIGRTHYRRIKELLR